MLCVRAHEICICRYWLMSLFWPVQKAAVAVVKLLFLQDALPISNDGWTPLLWAAQKGHDAVVKLLLEKGAQLGSKAHRSETPPFWAQQQGHEAVVKQLLETYAQLVAKTNTHYPPRLLPSVEKRLE